MSSKLRWARVMSVMVLLAMVLAGCAAPATPVAEPKVLRENLGEGDIASIDPALAQWDVEIQITQETTVGLTHIHWAGSKTVPGMATSWDVSGDGLTYTFHLRKDVPWVRYNPDTGKVEKVLDEGGKDRMVNAHDFVYGLRRTLNPDTASPYAFVLYNIKGAPELNTAENWADLDEAGKQALLEGLGVKALDDSTVEMTFSEDYVFNPTLAGLWGAHAQPQWLIEEKGEEWVETGNFQGHGPYTVKEWNHDVNIVLIKNPFWPGSEGIPQAKIDMLDFNFLAESAQFANYEAGTQDLATVPLPEMDRVKADPTLSKEFNIHPDVGIYYYGFGVDKPPVDDPRVRLAFSMAVDRQAVVENVTKGGQIPARWFTAPGVAAAPDPDAYPDLGVTYDPEGAKALLQEYLDEKGITVDELPPITLMVNQVEGHIKIAEAIQAMWKDVLGVNVNLVTQETKVYIGTLTEDPPQIWRLGWGCDYPDASSYTKDVFHSLSENNYTRWNREEYGTLDPDFDRLVDEAAKEKDPKNREALYVQAEEILVEKAAAIIPIYWYTRVSVTKPYVERTFGDMGRLQTYEEWDILPH